VVDSPRFIGNCCGEYDVQDITQARQGLQRLEVIEQEQRQRAIAQAAIPVTPSWAYWS